MESGAEQSLSSSILDYDVFDLADRVFDAYPEPECLENFGPYQIRGRIDKGGMGEVWRAYDYIAGREVAIKIPRYLADPALRRRFATEVTHQAKLEHPFIARLYDHGVCPDGTPYFAMEFVDGKPLDEYCRDKNLPLQERVRMVRAVCEAVQYAHGLLVVHRDLKPSNILVKDDGTPKLLDFGVAARLAGADEPARQTQTEVGFTRAFAAPEQFRRELVGVYTDVYALGVILYQLLTGRLPYDLEDCTPGQAELMVTGEREPAKPSEVARKTGKADWNDLDVLCLTAMKKDVPRRYSSVVQFAQDIDHYLKGEPLLARPDALSYRVGKFVRRNRRAIVLTVMALTLLVGLVVFFSLRLAKERNAALAEAARVRRVESFTLDLFSGGDEEAGPSENLRAITLLERGVREAQALNADPGVQADVYQTLGTAYQNLGNYDQADSLLKFALEKRKLAFGSDDQRYAESLLKLGLLKGERGELAQAEQLTREALAIDRRHLPPDHPAVSDAMTGLGFMLDRQGRYEEAIKVLSEAVRLQSTPAGDKTILSSALTYLATAQYHLGRLAIAESLSRQQLDIDRQAHGAQHPDVAIDLMDLGSIQTQLSHYADAEQQYRQALQIQQAWYGKDHPRTADMMSYVARSLVSQGRYDEAEILLKESLAILERAFGKTPDHKVAFAESSLGAIALARGRFDEAEKDYDRALQIERAVYGERHPFIAVALYNLGEVYLEEGQVERAEKLFRDAVDRLTHKSTTDPLYVGIAHIKLGRALVREKRYQEAEPETLAGYEALTQREGKSPSWLRKAREDLIAVYDALQQPEKAARYRAELAGDAAKSAVSR
jgi:serine/threonine-protein kinase